MQLNAYQAQYSISLFDDVNCRCKDGLFCGGKVISSQSELDISQLRLTWKTGHC